MTLVELGAALREAREGCGYSVEEVATRLKIMVRVVRAIEEGDEASLPHPVYARGFIKAYATLVGVDESEARDVLSELADPYDEAQPVQLAPQTRQQQERRAGGGLLPTLVVLCAIAFGVFWFRGPLGDVASELIALVENIALPTTATPAASDAAEPRDGASAIDTSTLTPSTSETPQTPAPSSSAASPSSSAMSVPPASAATAPSGKPVELNADGLPAGLTDAAPAAPTDSDVPGTGNASTDAPSAPPDTTLTLQTGDSQTDLTRAGKGKHQIIMTAVAECWVHSSADGTITRQFSLKKGETFALSFENKLVIKLGNAGGVRIKYDGEELPAPGKMGQVKTITFPPAPEAGTGTAGAATR